MEMLDTYGVPNHCYRFEHLGDTVLGLAVTGLMLNMYPGLRVGPSTVSRYTPERLFDAELGPPENQGPDCWERHAGRDVRVAHSGLLF